MPCWQCPFSRCHCRDIGHSVGGSPIGIVNRMNLRSVRHRDALSRIRTKYRLSGLSYISKQFCVLYLLGLSNRPQGCSYLARPSLAARIQKSSGGTPVKKIDRIREKVTILPTSVY